VRIAGPRGGRRCRARAGPGAGDRLCGNNAACRNGIAAGRVRGPWGHDL